MRREPKLRASRRSMAYRLTHEPPDDPWTDVAVIGVCMVLLAVCCLMASIVPKPLPEHPAQVAPVVMQP